MKSNTPIALHMLCPGQSARIQSLHCDAALQRRLLELGFIEHTVVRCLYQGSCGSPIAFCVRGAVIALRATDAAKITAYRCD